MKKISYSPLWKSLIDQKKSKSDLREAAQLSRTTSTKMGKDESVTMDVILHICNAPDGAMHDVVEVVNAPEEA